MFIVYFSVKKSKPVGFYPLACPLSVRRFRCPWVKWTQRVCGASQSGIVFHQEPRPKHMEPTQVLNIRHASFHGLGPSSTAEFGASVFPGMQLLMVGWYVVLIQVLVVQLWRRCLCWEE